MDPHLRVVSSGPLSSVQDLGRWGYRRFGIARAGAIDPIALCTANALVGNDPGLAGVEFTVVGDEYEVEAESCRIAVAGDFALRIDGRAASTYRTYTLWRGQRLAVGGAQSGARGYLAVTGGFRLEPVLGSRSTHTRSAIGGLRGDRLRPGDRLPLVLASAPEGPEWRIAGAGPYRADQVIRVMLGPQDDYFTARGIEALLESSFTISPDADRMGYRLRGPTIEHRQGFNIISDGIAVGSVQVPGSGDPIVLLADCQTTGGYPKIATVIGADLPALGQRRPGDAVRFAAVDWEAARRLRAEMEQTLGSLASRRQPIADDPSALDSRRLLSVNLISGVSDGAVA